MLTRTFLYVEIDFMMDAIFVILARAMVAACGAEKMSIKFKKISYGRVLTIVHINIIIRVTRE